MLTFGSMLPRTRWRTYLQSNVWLPCFPNVSPRHTKGFQPGQGSGTECKGGNIGSRIKCKMSSDFIKSTLDVHLRRNHVTACANTNQPSAKRENTSNSLQHHGVVYNSSSSLQVIECPRVGQRVPVAKPMTPPNGKGSHPTTRVHSQGS